MVVRWGVTSVKDFLEMTSFIAIIVGLIAYTTTRKQLSFSVMIECVKRFQALLPDLEHFEALDDEQKRHVMGRYIDLCEEELFYFRHGYLPSDLADEWLEGMLNFMPYYHESDKPVNDRCILPIRRNDPSLKGYPRLRKCFGHDKGVLDPYEERMRDLVWSVRARLDEPL